MNYPYSTSAVGWNTLSQITWNGSTSNQTIIPLSWQLYDNDNDMVSLDTLKQMFKNIKENGNKEILYYLNDENENIRKIAKLFLDFIELEKDSNETSS